MNRIRPAVVAAALSAALAVPAAGFAASTLPPTRVQGGVAYLSGGIGEDEARTIERAAHQWPLELEFVVKAQPRAEFTADVKVAIRNAQGETALDTTASGPFLLAKLAPGEYTISAERGGHKLERHVTIAPQNHEREVFEWAS